MTSAYIDAITTVACNSTYFDMTREQIAQHVQFRALDIEIERAEVDLDIREASIDWPCRCNENHSDEC